MPDPNFAALAAEGRRRLGIHALTAERDALATRERGYLSELADYGKTVERLRAQVTRLQALIRPITKRLEAPTSVMARQQSVNLHASEVEQMFREARDAE